MAAIKSIKLPKGHIIGSDESAVLENLIKECTETEATWSLRQNDIVFALAFWSMIKCGFQCVPSEESQATQNEKSDDKTLPKAWKHETRRIYEVEFFLPPHLGFPVKLVALPVDDILCINVIASNISAKNVNLISLAIYSTGYVPRPEEDAFTSMFSDLNDLQFLLKNMIVWPIRCSILTDQGIMNGSLCGLSDEIKLKIIQNLPVEDVLMLSLTCHSLYRVCNDQSLWKIIFHKYYKTLCDCSMGVKACSNFSNDWKECFKEAYFKSRFSFQNSSPASSVTIPEEPQGNGINFDTH